MLNEATENIVDFPGSEEVPSASVTEAPKKRGWVKTGLYTLGGVVLAGGVVVGIQAVRGRDESEDYEKEKEDQTAGVSKELFEKFVRETGKGFEEMQASINKVETKANTAYGTATATATRVGEWDKRFDALCDELEVEKPPHQPNIKV